MLSMQWHYRNYGTMPILLQNKIIAKKEAPRVCFALGKKTYFHNLRCTGVIFFSIGLSEDASQGE
jgi:hypothetical protein